MSTGKIDYSQITSIGDLSISGWVSMSVKDEMRKNLIRKMKLGDPLFPGIIGYEKTVIPQLQHAILSRHDLILLGLRGQGKTKILRMLVNFLDEYVPVVEGSEINDDPFHPVSAFAKRMISDLGDRTPVTWIHRNQRFGEKLATPDTTVADLIGDLDPIKAAARKLSLSDEQIINFGLIPRTNRGIFVINELPDLQPRIQVALLNIMQERDIQIRGFNIRMPLDITIAFSANPEDYTNRGNIITPLKDRIDAQIITHYPKTVAAGIAITEQEADLSKGDSPEIDISPRYREIIELVAFKARNSDYVNQKSGVSTRLTITAMEMAFSSAERRALVNNEKRTVIRISDLYHMIPALTGKMELVYEGEQEGVGNVARLLIGQAVNDVYKRHFPDPQRRKVEREEGDYAALLKWFSDGNVLDLSDNLTDREYRERLDKVPGLSLIVRKSVRFDSRFEATLMDLILEGLHQNSMLGKEDLDDNRVFTDMLGSMLGNIGSINPDESEDTGDIDT